MSSPTPNPKNATKENDARVEAAAAAIYESWKANDILRAVCPAEEGECREFAEVALQAADEVQERIQPPRGD